MKSLTIARVRKLLAQAPNSRVLVLGDVMLDRYVWGARDPHFTRGARARARVRRGEPDARWRRQRGA